MVESQNPRVELKLYVISDNKLTRTVFYPKNLQFGPNGDVGTADAGTYLGMTTAVQRPFVQTIL